MKNGSDDESDKCLWMPSAMLKSLLKYLVMNLVDETNLQTRVLGIGSWLTDSGQLPLLKDSQGIK